MDRCSHEAAQEGGLDSPLFKVCQAVSRIDYCKVACRNGIFIADNELLHNSV